jgi:hypothetical protein
MVEMTSPPVLADRAAVEGGPDFAAGLAEVEGAGDGIVDLIHQGLV